MIIKGYRVGPLVKRTGKEILDDNVLGLSAQTAYYFFFSLFPIFLFLAPLLGIIGDKRENMTWILNQLAGAVPPEAFAPIQGVVRDVVFADNAPGIASVGALLALWAGSNVFTALIDSLNAAYDVTETRPFWKKKLISIAAVLGIGVMFALATVTMLGGEDIVGWVSDHLGLGEMGRLVWTVLQFAFALAILVLSASLVYYFLPNVPQRKWHVFSGALVATVLWLAVTMAFRWYVQNFANYNKTYGTIGGVIVLLTWMYWSMVVLLIGGEFASELHKGTGAVQSRIGHLYGDHIATGGVPDVPSTQRVERLEPRMG